MSVADSVLGEPAETTTTRPSWSLNPTLVAGFVVGLVLAGTGLILARPDMVLIGIPLLIASAWSWDARGGHAPRVTMSLTLAPSTVRRGGIPYLLRIAVPREARFVHLRFLTIGEGARQIAVTAAAASELRGALVVPHSGPQEILALDYRLISPGGGFVSDPIRGVSATRVITPALGLLSTLPLPPRLQGLTGSHDSRRPGEGGDFHDVSLFSAGDRLRRIDWKATARRASRPGELYVRRSAATADATVLIVIDSRDDVAENVESWGKNAPAADASTSMDLARDAAGSLAAAYIASGDRVGFRDLASQSRSAEPAAGGRHLARLAHMIASSHPSGAPERRRRAPAVTSGALVIVLSTFLDDEAGRMAMQWRATAHRVVAVDVLPAPKTESLNRPARVAYRIVMMERADRIRELRDMGVEVIQWQPGRGPMNAAAQLRALTRMRARAR